MSSNPGIMSLSLESDQNICRKDTGETRKLRLWSRGHVFIVRSCGIVDMWRPIYRQVIRSVCAPLQFCNVNRSESPSQVFVILLSWLYEKLSDLPFESWSSIILAYDNMCHLDNLKAARAPLPLPQPYYDKMWKQITKVRTSLQCPVATLT